jgi:hypothetical protein
MRFTREVDELGSGVSSSTGGDVRGEQGEDEAGCLLWLAHG